MLAAERSEAAPGHTDACAVEDGAAAVRTGVRIRPPACDAVAERRGTRLQPWRPRFESGRRLAGLWSSPEWTPGCQPGDRGFESHQPRFSATHNLQAYGPYTAPNWMRESYRAGNTVENENGWTGI